MVSDLFSVSPGGLVHAPILAELHQHCFAKGWSETEFTNLLTMPGAAAALVLSGSAQAARPVGFVLYRCAADECEIITLCVVTAHRRKGAAQHLLDFLHADVSGAGSTEIFLEVEEANRAAIQLYERAGYEQTGRRKNYYNTPDGRRDALLFRRNLSIATDENGS